jgi:DNA/RNA-binding domain of Phe-tRNA-synthetase-like protein
MLTISIDKQLFVRFPALTVGGFLVTHLDRAASALTSDDLHAAWKKAAAGLARGGITIENLTNLSPIREWRQAFAACGLKPSSYKGRVESLVRSVLKEGRVVTPVPIVTLYCAIAARHLAPLGGYDVDTLPASTVTVRPARPGSDWFLPLGARPNDVPLKPGVVVYAAGEMVLCWSFNHRDSRQTCLSADTTRAVFFSEAVMPQQAQTAADALHDLRLLLAERGARVSVPAFADTNTPAVALTFDDERRCRAI